MNGAKVLKNRTWTLKKCKVKREKSGNREKGEGKRGKRRAGTGKKVKGKGGKEDGRR